ncbi:hypothetical protein [Streptomyces phage Psst4]|uniref:Uncharacterized protein n=4 Tax=Rimavirus drgrey TaxID=2560783 RepID=A0A649VVM4_9CAUD|nr:hypothetical protein FDI43_gp46 [Streptomyces phage DrGrey]QAY17081.1 hypothetical protein SEA_POPY_47 [Streptomyces phage Popy]QEQ94659.1 hypothetical protein SEA_SOSHI_46 [Streptomyces phage Soshi]QGJ96587.1 hypothetical protein SEA_FRODOSWAGGINS_47 [Streptomyces phage FrodoSwaggins]WPJ30790.1 hypothetical protein [Streptomyces phage Psst4]ASU03959.1 hypothetical protein SEA_DRGREY_46 [Streptomyces phage DrGrey]
MDFSALFQRAGKVAANNSPAILTALSVSGAITSVYLAAKGAFQAAEIIREAEDHRNETNAIDGGDIPEIDFKKKAELTWKVYIPAATCLAMTVTATICANRVSERRAAAMASAYAFAEKSFKEYREKTQKKVGKAKEQAIRDEIVQDRITANPPGQTVLALASQEGSQLCWDKWTDRYFVSDMETIRKAVNDFNQELINSSYLSLSEFYHYLGIRPTAESDNIGWTTDALLEVDYSAALTDKGVAVIAIDFRNRPSNRISSLY